MKNRKIYLSLINISANFKPSLEELKALKSSTSKAVYMDIYRRKYVSKAYSMINYFANIGTCRTIGVRSILSYCIDDNSIPPDTIRSLSCKARNRMTNTCDDIIYSS